MSADGIGAYFSPDTLRPIEPTQPLYQSTAPTTAGMGAYFAPVTTMPIQAPLQVSGFGNSEPTTNPSKAAAIGLLFLLVFGVWLLKGKR